MDQLQVPSEKPSDMAAAAEGVDREKEIMSLKNMLSMSLQPEGGQKKVVESSSSSGDSSNEEEKEAKVEKVEKVDLTKVRTRNEESDDEDEAAMVKRQ